MQMRLIYRFQPTESGNTKLGHMSLDALYIPSCPYHQTPPLFSNFLRHFQAICQAFRLIDPYCFNLKVLHVAIPFGVLGF